MLTTQPQRIVSRIRSRGFVDNVWAVNNGILRLSARINEMRRRGTLEQAGIRLQEKAISGRELKKPRHLWKNYYYLPTNA